MQLDLLQCLHAVVGIENFISVRFQHHGQHHLVRHFILHDQDLAVEREHIRDALQRDRRGQRRLAVVSRDGAQTLQKLLLLIHELVRPLKDLVEAAVFPGLVGGEPARDHHRALLADVRHRAVMEGQQQLLSDEIVSPGQNHHKFVPAHPEYGAVLENVADQPARAADIVVAGLVAEGVVDLLQAVDVADHHGEFFRASAVDGLVVLLLAGEEGVLALDAGHGVDVREMVALSGPPVHVEVVGQHDEQGEADHADGDHHRAGVFLLGRLELLLHIALIRGSLAVQVVMLFIIDADVLHHRVV